MIFVCAGSLKYNFDRLFSYLDKLILDGLIKPEDIVVQSTIIPDRKVSYKTIERLSHDEYEQMIKDSDFVICHAGVGTIMNGLYNKKKIILVPRESVNKEHIDNHQFQISDKFFSLNYCLVAHNYEELKKCVCDVESHKFSQFESNTEKFNQGLNDLVNHLI